MTSKIILLEALEHRVESVLKSVLKDLQNLPEHQLLAPAPNGGWSIAQCLEHLNSYGLYYLPKIALKLQKAPMVHTDETLNSTWLGSYFIQMMDPAATKKYNAFKNHVPPLHLNAHEVVAMFVQQQELLLTYLQMARKVRINHAWIPISITWLIRLKLGEVFQFLIAHEERHVAQAVRRYRLF